MVLTWCRFTCRVSLTPHIKITRHVSPKGGSAHLQSSGNSPCHSPLPLTTSRLHYHVSFRHTITVRSAALAPVRSRAGARASRSAVQQSSGCRSPRRSRPSLAQHRTTSSSVGARRRAKGWWWGKRGGVGSCGVGWGRKRGMWCVLCRRATLSTIRTTSPINRCLQRVIHHLLTTAPQRPMSTATTNHRTIHQQPHRRCAAQVVVV